MRAGCFHHRRARRRRQPQLRDRAEDLYLHAAGSDPGHRMVAGDPAGVRGKLGAFDLAGALHHDAVMRQAGAVRQRLRCRDQFIELRHRVVGQYHVEAAGARRRRTVHQPHNDRRVLRWLSF